MNISGKLVSVRLQMWLNTDLCVYFRCICAAAAHVCFAIWQHIRPKHQHASLFEHSQWCCWWWRHGWGHDKVDADGEDCDDDIEWKSVWQRCRYQHARHYLSTNSDFLVMKTLTMTRPRQRRRWWWSWVEKRLTEALVLRIDDQPLSAVARILLIGNLRIFRNLPTYKWPGKALFDGIDTKLAGRKIMIRLKLIQFDVMWRNGLIKAKVFESS